MLGVIAMSQTVARGKIERFFSVRPLRFGYIVRFAVEKSFKWDNPAYCIVEVILNSKYEPDSPQLRLKFLHATEVKIGDLNATVGCVLAIQDISDRGLESTTYCVGDEEYRCFSLNCQDFEFEVSE
jgi:hypothetical protein